MKHIKTLACILAATSLFTACKDDDVKNPGNPIMEITGDLGKACFGDTLRFDIKASDAQVPLSTIHAELYFDSEMVAQQVIRTKVSGETYPVAIYVPYIAEIPDGQATLRLSLQNINFTTTEQTYSVNISHANYPYLTFVDEEGTEYRMDRVSMYNYEMTGNYPADMPGKIIAPAEGGATDEVIFGYENSVIVVDGKNSIPFTNGGAGEYTISFNTFTFEGAPFMSMSLNGNSFETAGDNLFQVDIMDLAKGSALEFEGVPDFDNWYLNPSFFSKGTDGSVSFMAYDGSYRFIADTKLKYFQVVKLSSGIPATLNEDGTGLAWIIGEGMGYPSVSNAPAWEPSKAIAMAPQSDNIYQVTVVGGENINVNAINFKFFGQQDWAPIELKGSMLVSESDLIGVGHGDDGHDDGNLYLKEGVQLEANTIYTITLDLTGGVNNAVLKTEVVGENEFDAVPVYCNGKEMNTTNNSLYSIVMNLNQNDNITITGNADMSKIYLDPDYFAETGGNIQFLPISGYYNVVLNLEKGYLGAVAVDESGAELTLQEDGTGALWLMGDCGNPSVAYAFGWTPGEAYCMAQVSQGVYQFTGKAGPALSETPGDRYQFDGIQMKFFWQDGWGGEFSGDNNLTMIGDSEQLLKLQDDGNFFLQTDVTLEEGATYRVTVDLSNGIADGTFNFEKL